jgi:hypothetical protein
VAVGHDLQKDPVWHQRADRVQAHILVCFLAYVLWKTLQQWQRCAGLGQSPRAVLDELRRIQSTHVVLPTDDGGSSDCGAWSAPMRLKPHSSIAWGSTSPNACGSGLRCSKPQQCSANSSRNCSKCRP